MATNRIESSGTLARTTLLLTPLQLVLRLAEAAFPLFLAAWFGSSAETDVYVFAATVFTFAGALVFAAYRDSALIPILTDLRLRRPQDLPPVTGSLVTHTTLVAAGWGALVSAAVASWFLVRYPPPLQQLALALIPPLALHLVGVALSFLLTALLNASHRFLAAPLASALGMGTTLLLLAATRNDLGVRAIPWAQLAGELVSVAALLAFMVARARLRFRPSLRLPDPVRRFLRQMPAHLGGQAITRLNPLVDQLFAGLATAAGGTTLLKLSGDVAGGPTALLQASLLPVLLSHLSEHFARGQLPSFRRQVRRTALTVFLLLVLVAGALVLLRGPALRLLYLRGQMTPAAVEAMQPILVAHLLGLPGFGVLLVLARAHIAAGNTRIMVSMGALNAGLNLVLNALLIAPLGLAGIALATSLTNSVVAAVFWWRLRPVLGASGGGGLGLTEHPRGDDAQDLHLDPAGVRPGVELLDRPLARGRAQPLSGHGILQQPQHGHGHRLDVGRTAGQQQPLARAQHLGHAPDVEGDHRLAEGH